FDPELQKILHSLGHWNVSPSILTLSEWVEDITEAAIRSRSKMHVLNAHPERFFRPHPRVQKDYRNGLKRLWGSSKIALLFRVCQDSFPYLLAGEPILLYRRRISSATKLTRILTGGRWI